MHVLTVALLIASALVASWQCAKTSQTQFPVAENTTIACCTASDIRLLVATVTNAMLDLPSHSLACGQTTTISCTAAANNPSGIVLVLKNVDATNGAAVGCSSAMCTTAGIPVTCLDETGTITASATGDSAEVGKPFDVETIDCS